MVGSRQRRAGSSPNTRSSLVLGDKAGKVGCLICGRS